MFIRKCELESLKNDIKFLYKEKEDLKELFYEVRRDHNRLLDALGLVKRETHVVEYVKKGGPERGSE